MRDNITAIVAMLLWIPLVGCSAGSDHPIQSSSGTTPPESLVVPTLDLAPGFRPDSVVLAVNVGGGAHTASDGVQYDADTDSVTGRIGRIEDIRGSQDGHVFESYRAGAVRISQAIENGVYDLTFMFAEPDDIPVGARVFSVFAEGTRIIADMDVRLARDNNHKSALVRTVSGIQVIDGRLDIHFENSAGEALLNAYLVRRPSSDPREWKLVWSDEFDYQGVPDPAKWNVDVWPAKKVNGEDQAYTARLRNVRVENGHLVLEAHREQWENARYTSGRIHSQFKGDFLYGKAEVGARLAAGQGTWSAIWMLPTNPYHYSTTCKPDEDWQGSRSCDAWPNSGEIDIMEHVGYDMNTVHGTVHNRAYYFINQQQRKASIMATNVADTHHVYKIEWTPERIDILLNDSHYFTYMNDGTGWRSWPYDHPYHLVMNLAIGGDWGRAGGPIDDSIFPVKMEVDYVRVFEQISD
jgi:beta-glucanase (GH16 family)